MVIFYFQLCHKTTCNWCNRSHAHISFTNHKSGSMPRTYKEYTSNRPQESSTIFLESRFVLNLHSLQNLCNLEVLVNIYAIYKASEELFFLYQHLDHVVGNVRSTTVRLWVRATTESGKPKWKQQTCLY